MKPLSERLLEDVGYADVSLRLYEAIIEAAALAKSVESAPVGAFEDVANTVSYVGWIDTMPGRELPLALRDSLNGQRVALVPLPQQSES